MNLSISNKILDLKQAEKQIKLLKIKKKKIALCHGVFDVVHLGHIEHFKFAKSLCDVLVVSVTEDKFVKKGFGRPMFDLKKRAIFLSNLSIVDFVVLSDNPTASKSIKIIKPDYYVKGPDYKKKIDDLTGKISEESSLTKKFGGKFVVSKGFTFSSSKIINEYLETGSEQEKYLKRISKKYTKFQVQQSLEKLKNLNVLVLGESIIDEYNFCETIGKSGKEPVLNLRHLFSKRFLGGGIAICNNLANFCKKITYVTYLGEKREEEKFIKKNLKKNINFLNIYKKKSPTIVKRRYLENISNIKIHGIYSVNDDYINKKEEKSIISKLKNNFKKNDLTIVSDYGHGLVTKKIAKLLSGKQNKCYLNAQLNSNNIGNHTLDNYNSPEAIIINERELRHELRDKSTNIIKLAKKLKKIKKSRYVLVTQGKDGLTLVYKNKSIKCPAFANKVVDKIGSGDTILAFFSICIANKIDPALSLYIASNAAALNVESFANERLIEKSNILKVLSHNFK